jgi:hypothetical protein
VGRLVPPRAANQRRRERLFFSGMTVAFALAVVVGFAPTYFLKGVYGGPALSSLLHVHGALFTGWIVLLIVQTSLVAAGRTRVHRRLGVAGGVLAAAMVVAGYLAAVDAARRGSTIPGMSPQAFMAIPMMDMVVFSLLIGTALALRRRTDMHKRLMLIGTADLVTAAVARIPAIGAYGPLGFFGVADLFIVAIAVYDFATTGRVHRATIWGGAFLVASQAARLAIANTGPWLVIAQWMTG